MLVKHVCIIFMKWPEAGKVKTRLAQGSSNAMALAFYKLCCEHVIRQLSGHAKWQCVVAYSGTKDEAQFKQWLSPISKSLVFQPQLQDPDLGVRMGHSIRGCLLAGAQKVLLVGSDIPDLDAGILEAAFSALDKSKVVLGPAKDGGYYLLGGKIMPTTLLEGVEWSTEYVLSATLHNCSREGIVADSSSLPVLQDIDTMQDLRNWIHSAKDGHALEAMIQKLLSSEEERCEGNFGESELRSMKA